MNTKRFGFAGVLAAAALAFSTLVAPSASAATEIVVWADESRGPNLTKVTAEDGLECLSPCASLNLASLGLFLSM